MLVKVQLGEKEYIYLNLAQTIIVHFSKEDFTIYIRSVYSTATCHVENEIFYSNAQDLIDEYTLHPLEEKNDTEKYRLDVNAGGTTSLLNLLTNRPIS